MPDVQFNEPSYETSARTQAAKGPSRLSKMVMAAGLAKDEKSAQMVLLIIAGICIVLAAFVYFTSQPPTSQPPPVTAPVLPQ